MLGTPPSELVQTCLRVDNARRLFLQLSFSYETEPPETVGVHALYGARYRSSILDLGFTQQARQS